MIDYNKIDWKSHFYYDEDSPSCLKFKHDVFAGRTGKTLVKAKDSNAGCLSFNPNGTPKSWEVGFCGKLYKAHRIIWVLFNESIENELVVDHLNGDASVNKIDNLRLIPKFLNHRNIKKPNNNTSGYCGVYWQRMNKGKHLYAVAEIKVLDNKFVKCFGTHIYSDPLSEAILWRESKILELNINGAGFTDRHGK